MKRIYALQLLLLYSIACSVSAQHLLPCGVDDSHLPDSTIQLMSRLPQLMRQQRARLSGERNICRLAIEIDSDTYLEFEKDTNQIKRVFTEKIERVSKIYEREINTQLVIVYFHIWKDTEPDPYRGEGNLYNLYPAMSRVWANQFRQIAYDKRVYLITKASSGAGGLGGGQQAVVANLADTYTIAHELGHCFDSPHTHNCSWPGGPIDFCSTIDTDGKSSCYTASLQTINGTIMSYCGTNLTFHPLCQALMTNHAVVNFPKVTALPAPPLLPARITLTRTPFLFWNASTSADRYAIEVASDVGFTQKITSDTTSLSGYLLSKLAAGSTYYVRVRATNSFGESAWSATSQVTVPVSGEIPAPVLISPTPDQNLIPLNQGNRTFAVQPVAGATSYDIQIADATDEFFKYPSPTESRAQPSFTVSNYRLGTVRWRVRAIVNGKAGPWSLAGRYSVNPESYYISFPFYGSDLTPLTVPFGYYTTTGRDSRVVATLATDSLFTKPVYSQAFDGNYNYTGLLDKLVANTTYYLKLEEYNTKLEAQPIGLLTRTMQTFRTGQQALSDRWSFVTSATHPGWPQGFANSTLVTAGNNVWYGHTNGLTRISQDSLKLRTYDQSATSGRIGNASLAYDTDGAGNIWVTNRVSVNVFKDGFPVNYNQLGKLSEETGTLTEKTAFTPGKYGINLMSASPRLFYSYNAIQELRNDSLANVYSLPTGQYISKRLVQTGQVWLLTTNPSTGNSELIRFNLLTRTSQTFSNSNTPQLGKYIQNMAADALGNIWVSQSHTTNPFPPLARFNGQTWTGLSRPDVPISYALAMANDPLGNLYLIDNTSPRSLYRYNGVTWKKLADMPFYYSLGSLTVDRDGNLWFAGTFQLIRYTACANAPTPVLTTAKQTIEIGDNTTLQAVGCTDVLWSWTNDTEIVTNRLVRSTNQLVVKPETNTTYRSRCYTGTCAGSDTTLAITVLPRINLIKTNKTALCHGDSLTTSYGLQGKVSTGNQFSFVFKSGTQSTTLSAVNRGATASALLPASLPPGRYVVYLQTTQPVVRTRDSVTVTLLALPTAELSSNKPTFTLGDSARVSVALTGIPPWRFMRWDNQVIQTSVTPYTTTLMAAQPTTYSLVVTNLSDANCATGIIRNSVLVSALALGTEPIIPTGIRVFPNPADQWITIEVEPSSLPLAGLQIIDGQGRVVQQRQLPGHSRYEQLDLRMLPATNYVLRIELANGTYSNWKVLKR